MSKSPGDQIDPVATEIQAEIADHLATSAERLEAQGIAAAAARQKSEAKFGDAATISRRCYWIKQGDTLMFRAAIIAVLSVLSIALGIATFTSWQSQRQMAQQMAMLAEQLKVLAERQQTIQPATPVSAEQEPLEITGKVFFRSPDNPAAGNEVMICRASDGEIVRRVSTKDDGAFQSGPLTAGDYTLVAKGVKGAPGQQMGIQTAPLYVYPGVHKSDAQIDAIYRSGRIAVELSRPLPAMEVEGKYKIDSRLYLAASTTEMQSARWTAAQPMPGSWPIYVTLPDMRPAAARGSNAHTAVLSNAELDAAMGEVTLGGYPNVPSGPCSFVAGVVADIVPADFAVVSRGTAFSSFWMSKDYVLREPMGAFWMAKLKQKSGRYQGNLPTLGVGSGIFPIDFSRDAQFVAHAVIGDGAKTRLRIEIPSDIESQIQRLVETVTDPNEFEQAVRQDNPFIRQVKLTVVVTETKNDDSGE